MSLQRQNFITPPKTQSKFALRRRSGRRLKTGSSRSGRKLRTGSSFPHSAAQPETYLSHRLSRRVSSAAIAGGLRQRPPAHPWGIHRIPKGCAVQYDEVLHPRAAKSLPPPPLHDAYSTHAVLHVHPHFLFKSTSISDPLDIEHVLCHLTPLEIDEISESAAELWVQAYLRDNPLDDDPAV